MAWQVFSYDCLHVAHPGMMLINGQAIQPQFVAASDGAMVTK